MLAGEGHVLRFKDDNPAYLAIKFCIFTEDNKTLYKGRRVLSSMHEPAKYFQERCRTRICASLGSRMKFKTLFMSGEEKHGHHFDLPLFFNMLKQFLAPAWGFECRVCSS